MQDETSAGLRLDAVRIRLDGRELVAVDRHVRPGETLTVMGPSGSGKSTLLAYVGGFLDPVFSGEGRVICGGRDIAGLPAEERHAGILFQDPLLFPHISVGGNLVFAIPKTISGKAARRARAEAAGLKIASAGVGFANLIFAGQFCYKEFDGETLPPRPAYDPSLPWVGDCDDPDSMEKARTVRHAMSMAVDRKALVQAIAGGHGRPTYVEMLQGAFGDRYMKDEWVTPFDPEKATKLIADAGYPDGFDFDFICMGTGHPLQNEFCEATAAMWSNIGLRPQIRNVSTEALRKQQVERTLNAVRMEVRTGTSPIPEARGFGELPNAAFNSGYEMPGLAELVRKAYVATSDAELDKIREQEFEWSFYNALSIPLAEFDEIYAYNPEKIASWDRTPFNGHSEEIMDFESIEKP